MPTPYTVKSGDTLSRIALRHGIRNWRTLYYHPINAGFRRLRPNPHRIYPGDVIQIPDPSAPGVTHPGRTPGPPVLITDDKCCALVKENECPYTGSKSNYTCPSGYTKFCWMCCEGSSKIGCGECIKQASNPTDCWDATDENAACSIWWDCATDCDWCIDQC